MHWGIYALLSAIFAALVAIFGKIGLAGIDSTLATTIRSIVMAGFLVLISSALGKFAFLGALNSRALTFIVLSGIAGAVSWLFYFFALKSGSVAGVAALDRTSVVFAFLLAILFLGEALTWQKVLGVIFVAIGAILMVL
jgi:transporter family protein